MTDAQSSSSKRPWHLWLIGVTAALWNGFGVYDCAMTLTGGEDYLRSYGMTDAQIAYFTAMPQWMFGVWLLGTGGG
ncbi:MAG: hypothetical protein ABW199_01855 [Caulobacterales bacterium]